MTCRSVRHAPQARTRTRTSPAPGSGMGRSADTRGEVSMAAERTAPWNACVGALLVQLVRRGEHGGRSGEPREGQSSVHQWIARIAK